MKTGEWIHRSTSKGIYTDVNRNRNNRKIYSKHITGLKQKGNYTAHGYAYLVIYTRNVRPKNASHY